MKHIIKIFLLAYFGFNLSSCTEDSFSQVVEFDVPKVENRLVLSCNYTVGQDSMVIFVGKSRNVGEIINIDKLDLCKVTLYRGNDKVSDFTFNGQLGGQNAVVYRADGLSGKIEAGATYNIKVEHPDFKTVEATQVVPKSAKLSKGLFKREGFPAPDIFNPTQKYDLIQFELIDSNEEDFYILSANATYRDTLNNIEKSGQAFFYLDKQFSNDGLFSGEPNTKHFLNDLIFNNKAFDVKFGVPQFSILFNLSPKDKFNPAFAKLISYDVEIYSITKQKYLYETSIEARENSLGSFFTEPVTVNSNIVNGYGIFSIRNKAGATILVP
jgi:hypothetical protein